MNTLRRAARVVAEEGFAGLVRRMTDKIRPPRNDGFSPTTLDTARAEFEGQVSEFRQRTAEFAVEGIDNYYWYHTIDLGNGLVTPGDYDFRPVVPAFGFPESLTGQRVLDVGSATGFFAFEFERRGADVVSVELPSLGDWDILAAERDRVLTDLMAWLQAQSPAEAYTRHLSGPFQFCHRLLNSRIERCYSSVYDLTLRKLGNAPFDMVYVGDVLLHLFAPLKALDVLANVCSGTMVLTIEVPFPGTSREPLFAFMGCQSEDVDRRTWWAISREGIFHILRRLGFRNISVVGRYSGLARRAWFPYHREVIRATR